MVNVKDESVECLKDYWKDTRLLRSEGKWNDKQSMFWDMRADRYAIEVSNDNDDRYVASVLSLLDEAGFKPKGKRVLDIGSGPGTLALPLSRMGAKVTALDISAKMLLKLEENAGKEGIRSIETIHASWHGFDLDCMGLRGRFDLVIASMTPAVSDVTALDKMMEASRGLCFYSGFLGRRWDKSYYDLYKSLYGEEFSDMVTGFHIPFMYLYLLGYRPLVKVYRDVWSTDEPVDEMADMVLGFFDLRRKTEACDKEAIKRYLAMRASNGLYHSETSVIGGMMVWYCGRT